MIERKILVTIKLDGDRCHRDCPFLKYECGAIDCDCVAFDKSIENDKRLPECIEAEVNEQALEVADFITRPRKSLEEELLGILGVTRVEVECNESMEAVGDMPGMSMRARVEGGHEGEIVEAILRKKTIGYMSVGEVVRQATDAEGCIIEVRFSREFEV